MALILYSAACDSDEQQTALSKYRIIIITSNRITPGKP